MKELLAKYRLILVTALIAVAGVVRVAKPDWVVPSDTDIASWCDAFASVVAPALWLFTYYHTDTQKGTLQETPK